MAAETLSLRTEGAVAVLGLDRPHKRNAIDDDTVRALGRFFADPPSGVRAAVLHGEGEHFCAGLDLGSLTATDVQGALAHSQLWHRTMAALEGGRVPVIVALRGAVIGGGLELAAAGHVRVAGASTFYALPEGQRGLFLGGGGTVRLPRLIGTARVMDLILTGRVLDAPEGQAAGLSQYLVADDEVLPTALGLAQRAAEVADLTTYAVLQALPRIAAVGPQEGSLFESLMAAVASSSPDAQHRMQEFLAGRAAKVAKDEA